MNEKLQLIKEIYGLQENDLAQRKEALEKLEPFVNEIMDRFYEKLLQKEEIAKFIPIERIAELKEKQIKFIAELLSKPFDEKLYRRIARVGIAHYHIDLDPISMSYGYHVLSELILAQSQKDPSLLPYLQLIIKYLKVAEAIMTQEYFAQKSLAKSPYRANDLFVAINRLHAAFMRCHSSFERLKMDQRAKEDFEKMLKELSQFRDILSEAGLHLATIKRLCTQFTNEPTQENLQKLQNTIFKPLDNLRIASYLSLASALATLRVLTDIVYKRRGTNEKNITIKMVQNTIEKLLLEHFGWAIEELRFLENEPESGYEIVKHLALKDEVFFLAINTKDVIDKLYIQEAIDLITESIKLTLFVRSKEAK